MQMINANEIALNVSKTKPVMFNPPKKTTRSYTKNKV